MPANNFNFKNSYQFVGKYDSKKSYISEFSDKFLIFRAYSRDYESYNKKVSLYPLYPVSENTLYIQQSTHIDKYITDIIFRLYDTVSSKIKLMYMQNLAEINNLNFYFKPNQTKSCF